MCRRYAGPFVLVRPAQNASIRSCCSFEVFPGESFALLGVGVTVALQLGKLSESPPPFTFGANRSPPLASWRKGWPNVRGETLRLRLIRA